MWTRTDDPVFDAECYYAELEDERQRMLPFLPVCSHCGEPMECEDLYDIGGVLICENCIFEYKHPVDEYIQKPNYY